MSVRASTRLIRFCASTDAMSRLTPVAKVSVSVKVPLASELDSMYSRFSMPFISCSISVVTESSITCALAPG